MSTEATSRLAVRAVPCALLLAGCLGLTGCSLFKQSSKDRAPDTGGGVPPPKFPTGGNGAAPNAAATNNNITPTNGVTNAANQGAILAGRVIDGYSRPPNNTSIRWVGLDDKKETENEVSVTPEGYFTIQGLKPGAHYKLLARGKQGERLVAGISYTMAPNIRVLIQVSDDLANGSTPAVPGPPVASPQNDPNKTSGLGTQSNPNGSDAAPPTAYQIPGNNHANEPDLPVAISVNTQARGSAPSQNWVPANVDPMAAWPPTLQIPPKARPAPPPLLIPNPPPPVPPELKAAPVFPKAVTDLLDKALIPSCVRVGPRIVNFALNDVNGQPWELKHRTGKLVLVDFWATYCTPCLQSMPHLRDLQAKYGSQGLEVVGIANEADGSTQEQAYRVMNVCKKMGINYRQLLSSGPECPVRKEFKVNFLPSLYLLDEQGIIIWYADHGVPTADEWALLNRHIQRNLPTRAY